MRLLKQQHVRFIARMVIFRVKRMKKRAMNYISL